VGGVWQEVLSDSVGAVRDDLDKMKEPDGRGERGGGYEL